VHSGSYRFSSDIIQVSARWSDYLVGESDLDLTPASLMAIATDAHERKHHVDISQTPFGLLLWRTESSICVDTHFLCRNYGHPEPPHTIFDRIPRQLDLVLPSQLAAERNYARLVSSELRTLMRFRELILDRGPEGATIGEAVLLANTALDVLRSRFDLHTKWHFTTALPSSLRAVPVGRFREIVGRDVLERSATAHERKVVSQLAGRHSQGEGWWLDWRDALARYKDVGGFADDGTQVSDVLARAEWALEGPCDPAIASTTDIPLESALPAWRWAVLSGILLPKEVAPGCFLPWAEQGTCAVYENLSSAMLDGPEGMFMDAKLAGFGAQVQDPTVSYNAFVLARYTTAFRIRSGHPNKRWRETASLVSVFQEMSRVAEQSELSWTQAANVLETLMRLHATQESSKACAYGLPLNVSELVRALYLMQLRVHSLRSESTVNVVAPIRSILQDLHANGLISRAQALLGVDLISQVVIEAVDRPEKTHAELIRDVFGPAG